MDNHRSVTSSRRNDALRCPPVPGRAVIGDARTPHRRLSSCATAWRSPTRWPSCMRSCSAPACAGAKPAHCAGHHRGRARRAARIVPCPTRLYRLEETGGRYGLQTMCEAGGMANATNIERAVTASGERRASVANLNDGGAWGCLWCPRFVSCRCLWCSSPRRPGVPLLCRRPRRARGRTRRRPRSPRARRVDG